MLTNEPYGKVLP